VYRRDDPISLVRGAMMHAYRSHTCAELNKAHVGQTVRLSGWVHRVRDHGGVLFIDLRDHYGITQVLADSDSPAFAAIEKVRAEWVICIDGRVKARDAALVNPKIPTGEVEVYATGMTVLGAAEELPMPVFGEVDYPEETRLTYRFLDLRREKLHRNMMLRSNVVRSLRNRMWGQGFNEFQTPIITASSPEGARDFLVPSRLHPGKFYALPQAPQQFKQLIMVAGFDRYFQIAPCFRDEDPRADRSPTDFYQLDVEMSFVEQEDVFAAVQPVIQGLFEEFRPDCKVPSDWPRIAYRTRCCGTGRQAGPAQPDQDADRERAFPRVWFRGVREAAGKRGDRGPRHPGAHGRQPQVLRPDERLCPERGPAGDGLYLLARGGGWVGDGSRRSLGQEYRAGADRGDPSAAWAGPWRCGLLPWRQAGAVRAFAGKARNEIGRELGLAETDTFRFAWIVDFPMYEKTDDGKIDFSHNPFSMPQGGMEALMGDPLEGPCLSV
jgi:aspartyl-tRNA synthetase